MSPRDNHDFENRLRALYRRTSDEVDTATAARLREARRHALDAAGKPRLARWLVPVGAVAVCTLAVVTIWPSRPQPMMHHLTPVAATGGNADSVLPPDPDTTDPTMYQNLDFYAWLADQPATISRAPRGG